MMTKIMYSTIALGLAATVASAGELMINDFEKSDGEAAFYTHSWDSGVSGDVVNADGLRIAAAAAGESDFGLGIEVSGDIGFTMMLPVQYLGACTDITYKYKGAEHKLLVTSDGDADEERHYSHEIDASGEWTEASFDLKTIRNKYGWGQNTLDPANIVDIRWDVESGSEVRYLYIDDVKCTTIDGFEISFMNGETVLQKKTVSEGEMPRYTGATPQKESSEEYDYFFKGWTPELVEATEDASYQAVFESAPVYKIAEGETVLIDDFEDGNFVSNWGGKISYYSDADEGGSSDLSYDIIDGDNSKNLKLNYMLDGGKLEYSYAGLVMAVAEEGSTRNLSSCKVLRYEYKGAAHNFRVQSDIDVGYQYHQKEFGKTTDWTQVTIALATDLKQPNWETTIKADIADVLKQATAIEWQMTSGQKSGTLEIDNVRCLNLPFYTITFMNGEDEVDKVKVLSGDIPECHYCQFEEKEPTEMYEYVHSGFSPELVAATKDATYQMTWDTKLRTFYVGFWNGETELQQDYLEYGSMPKYEGETPTKEATAQYTYTFKGWDPAIGEVKDNVGYQAVFEPTTNKYKISFVNGDDDATVISANEYEYGTLIADIAPANPTMVDPAGQVTYIFDGWSPEFDEETSVTGAATYTATYKTANNEFTVVFMNGDEVLQKTLVKAGEMPEYTGAALTKDADVQYTYSWNKNDGWDKELVAVTKSMTYMAKFTATVNKYTVTFKDDDGTELGSQRYEYGTEGGTVTLPEIVRTEPAWDEETYEYNYMCSWPEVETVTGDVTYTAQCDYRATFVFLDAVYEDELNYGYDAIDLWVPYGETPELTSVPVKEPTEKVAYVFDGWDKDLAPMGQHSVTYTAKFTEKVRQYFVKFVVGSTTIDSTMYDYGTTADKVVVPEATKEPTAQYTYKFTGWNKKIADVTKNVMYQAVFEENPRTYVVEFVVDGKVVSSKEYAYGTAAKDVMVPEETPTKAETAKCTYTFKAWDKELAEVTEAATYTAVFDSTVNKYTIAFVVDGKKTEAEYDYGTKAADLKTPETKKVATAQYTYTFKAWDKELADVTGAATYTAVFDETVNKYKVTFVVDGKETVAEYAYGTKAADLKTPETKKAATAQYTYTFKEWDKKLADVTEAATYTAVFDETVNKYKVTFVVDGKETVAEYAYGTKADDIKVPTASKEDTEDMTFTFDGWDKEIADVTEAATYTAKFTSKKTTAIAATVHSNFKFGFANNELTVEQPGASMVRVQVFDLTGHLVESFNEQVVGSKTFSLAHLNQGSYMVRVVSKSQIRSARITVR